MQTRHKQKLVTTSEEVVEAPGQVAPAANGAAIPSDGGTVEADRAAASDHRRRRETMITDQTITVIMSSDTIEPRCPQPSTSV
jgi:hypothetical protein